MDDDYMTDWKEARDDDGNIYYYNEVRAEILLYVVVIDTSYRLLGSPPGKNRCRTTIWTTLRKVMLESLRISSKA